MTAPAIPPSVVTSATLARVGGAIDKTGSLRALSAKYARVKRGTLTSITALLLGDSTTAGAGAGTGTNLVTGARTGSVAVALAEILTSQGIIPARADSFFGDQWMFGATSSQSFYPTYDPRVTLGNGAIIVTDATKRGLGGIPFRLVNANSFISFQPGQSWDTAVIVTRNTTAGTAGLSINGGASTAGVNGATSVTSTIVADTHTKVTITKALGTEALQIGNVTGQANTGQCVVVGAILYNSAAPSVNIIAAGAYGVRFTSDYAKYQEPISVLQPDVIIIDHTINDERIGLIPSLPAYENALRSTIGYGQAAGAAVIVATPNVITGSAAAIEAAAAYAETVRRVSRELKLTLADHTMREGSYADFNAAGGMADDAHPSRVGYWDKATLYGQILRLP